MTLTLFIVLVITILVIKWIFNHRQEQVSRWVREILGRAETLNAYRRTRW